jgi:hypothetical protein
MMSAANHLFSDRRLQLRRLIDDIFRNVSNIDHRNKTRQMHVFKTLRNIDNRLRYDGDPVGS